MNVYVPVCTLCLTLSEMWPTSGVWSSYTHTHAHYYKQTHIRTYTSYQQQKIAPPPSQTADNKLPIASLHIDETVRWRTKQWREKQWGRDPPLHSPDDSFHRLYNLLIVSAFSTYIASPYTSCGNIDVKHILRNTVKNMEISTTHRNASGLWLCFGSHQKC